MTSYGVGAYCNTPLQMAYPRQSFHYVIIALVRGEVEMKYNQERHHRRSVRLKGYDYSSPGAYFVTVCAWNRDCIFGEIINGEMKLNEYGKVIHREWMHTGDIRPNVELD